MMHKIIILIISSFIVLKINGQSFEIHIHRLTEAINEYDADLHKYNSKYVKPTGYNMKFVTPEDLKMEEYEERISEAEQKNKPTVPALEKQRDNYWKENGIQSRSFKVEGVGFNYSESTKINFLRIPKVGKYRIVAEIKYNNGKKYNNTRNFEVEDLLIVAMGDSYISGEGNPDIKANLDNKATAECKTTTIKLMQSKGETESERLIASTALFFRSFWGALKDIFTGDASKKPKWQELKAHRSNINGAYMASIKLRKRSESKQILVRFLSFARSGAKIEEGLVNPNLVDSRDKWINTGQINEAKKTIGGQKIDALIISIGGNDVNFSGSVKALTVADGLPKTERARVTKDVENRLKTLHTKYDLLKKSLSVLKINRTLIAEYPVGLYEKIEGGEIIDGGECGIFKQKVLGIGSSIIGWDPNNQSLDKEDGILFKKLGSELNKIIKSAAGKNSWIYVDGINDGFSGHGYCAEETYYIGAEESCLCQADFDGMVHPNKKGHQIYAKQIEKTIRSFISN